MKMKEQALLIYSPSIQLVGQVTFFYVINTVVSLVSVGEFQMTQKRKVKLEYDDGVRLIQEPIYKYNRGSIMWC